ncbi:MAG: hypothetical protein GY696_38050, partial [Gammaproteobacteria bacterium]|nr:hypothetical protein [Gammaproteobacteria bacterium]
MVDYFPPGDYSNGYYWPVSSQNQLIKTEDYSSYPSTQPLHSYTSGFEPCRAIKRSPPPSLSDVSEVDSGLGEVSPPGHQEITPSGGAIPPLTPGTNKNFSDVIKTTYGTWDKDSERLGVPRDPRLWSHEHVAHWLSWAIREFSLQGPHIDTFVASLSLSGRQVCSMSKEEFISRAPPFMGDILWAHLEILQKESKEASNDSQKVYQELTSSPVSSNVPYVNTYASTPTSRHPITTYDMYDQQYLAYHNHQAASAAAAYWNSYPTGHQWQLMSSPPMSVPTMNSHSKLDLSGEGSNSSDYTNSPLAVHPAQSYQPQPPSFNGSGPIQLWQFLLELLTDKSCQHFIAWTGDGWEFKMIDPDEVARRWGLRKNKLKMNYEKLSRGLRYYYDKNIILKTAGKRYIYR